MAKTKFMPEAAHAYAEMMGWKLPKKLKSADVLQEIVEGNIEEMVKDIPEKERYECEKCSRTVGEPDEYCWFCGADISDDGTGGFVVEDELFPSTDPGKTDDKKTAKKADKKDDTKKTAKKDDKKDDKKKDDDKKPAAKKKDVPPTMPPKKKDTALVKKDDVSGESSVIKSLKDYTAEIRRLDNSTGSMAWRIGKFLLEVKESQVYASGGYKDMADYVLSELEYSWQVARNFMRYATVVDEKQAGLLGTYKMELISRSPEDSREAMLKAALPKPDGQGMGRKALDAKLKKVQEKKKAASGKDPEAKRGRKPEPNKSTNLHSLIGTSLTVRMKNGEGSILIPDTACIVELNENKSSIKLTFYEADLSE